MKHDALLNKINETIEEKGNYDYKQKTISGGIIGSSCDRELWLGFRHCKNEGDSFKSKTLRLFADGHSVEDITAARWQDAGIQLQVKDYETGGQIKVESLGGWFKGLLDGVIHSGIPDNETTKYVWEGKCSASWPTKKHQTDESTCLLNWNAKYYGQAQSYMGLTNIHKHITSITKPGGRDELIIETPFDQHYFENSQVRAHTLITTDKMPGRITDDPDYYECKFCSVSDACHKGLAPNPTCRNCAFITFHIDGYQKATCSKHNNEFTDIKLMESYYPCHRFNPDLLKGDAVKFDDKTGSVTYRLDDGSQYVNGEAYGEFDSMEIYIANEGGFMYDNILKEVKKEFGSKLVSAESVFGEEVNK
tara:strand:+ start:23307 stop:24395 length:1089 start_codon:yes stop_codon:yes gene_type:complete